MVGAVMAAILLGKGASMPFIGGDISEIPEVEASGGQFRASGTTKDPLKILKESGWNAVRLRVWNEPKDGYCDMAHTLAMAKRIKAAGLKLMIDFHYSDSWADPAKQNKPAAWAKLDFEQLKSAIRDFSKTTVQALVAQGTPPDVVQPGNEVTNGMLWPDGQLHINTDGWAKFMELTKAAIAGIREGAGAAKPKIMIHIDQGGNNSVSRYWFENYFKRGGEADILGLSYYPFWHGTLDELRANLAFLANTYRKDILIAETAYPHTGWNDQTHKVDEDAVPIPQFKATPEGQAGYLRELRKIGENVPGNRGIGILWWAPTWIARPGHAGGWNRFTLFDPESGEALPGIRALAGGG
ncbi:MAG: glycosyl hydrolase 53 family protein [Armatimonadetes bacterium]|nr:glycosyl hydrolase 53 family protein [Armatimonadota bacterium]